MCLVYAIVSWLCVVVHHAWAIAVLKFKVLPPMTLFYYLLFLFSSSCSRQIFVRYESSAWEQDWLDHIRIWRDRECEILNEKRHRRLSEFSVREAQLMNRLLHVNNLSNSDNPTPSRDDVFSKMFFECNNHQHFEYIEPLVGLLRDPLTMCDVKSAAGVFSSGESHVQAKRFLVLSGSTLPHNTCTPSPALCSRTLLFDAGASTYGGWRAATDAVGAKWFVDRYSSWNISFDHIYAFEARPYDPKNIYATLPAHLFARYTYINLGIDRDPKSPLNLWTFVRSVARPIDRVIVKLDIDNTGIERELFKQLLHDDELVSLVDEMFFEDHTNVLAMRRWWKNSTAGRLLEDSYVDFLSLRRRGVRMHSWP